MCNINIEKKSIFYYNKIYKIMLVRCGRIKRPYYQLWLFRDYYKVDKLGFVSFINNYIIGYNKLKILALDLSKISYWNKFGFRMPIWLENIAYCFLMHNFCIPVLRSKFACRRSLFSNRIGKIYGIFGSTIIKNSSKIIDKNYKLPVKYSGKTIGKLKRHWRKRKSMYYL